MRRRGDVDHARALVVAVDAVALDRRLDGVEVLQAELLEQFDLAGESPLAVGDAVGERRLHEPSVATARRRPDLGGVDQHDVAGRVALLGDDCRPQPGVAAADDAQVARLGAHESRVGVRFVDVVVPVREQVGVGDGVEVGGALVVGAGHVVSPARLVPRQCRRTATRRYGMDLGISGKRAAVAAASSGLGLASAKALAAEGVKVAICGRDKARLDAAAAEVGARLRADRRRRQRRRRGSGVRRRCRRGARGRRHPRHQRRRAAGRATSPTPTSTPIPTPSASTCCRSSGCARRRRRRCRSAAGVGWWRSRRSPCASRSPT